MRVKIWGSRGSRPVLGDEFRIYGGDTNCIEIRADSGEVLILDAGTGLGSLERAWKARPELRPAAPPIICLSHGHLDHVQGLPFFSELYKGDLTIYAPFPCDWPEKIFDGKLFPVQWSQIKNGIDLKQIASGANLQIGPFSVETMVTNHPGGNLAWKISADGWTLVYTGDHEMPREDGAPELAGIQKKLLDFVSGADVALVDASFSKRDFIEGWGHCHFSQWPEALAGRGVKLLGFTHFNPAHEDAFLDDVMRRLQKKYPERKMFAAFAGCEIGEAGVLNKPRVQEECEICAFFQRISDLSDTHAVLDAMLTEARHISHADAGTIYLIRGDDLEFSAAQNDTLFPASRANKYGYMTSKLPLNPASIAGHVAVTGESINIDDVYNLPENCSFSFNSDFDKLVGYRTGPVLAVPIVNAHKRIIGVLQLINSKREGRVVPFTSRMQADIARLANMATIPLERSFLVTNMILRMLSTSALRDPSETGAHVRRVGAIAAELYQRWAEAHDIDPEEMLVVKGRLRLAAMLHDVGKIGIPDAILKKPGKLDDGEREAMQMHAALGADLFREADSEIDLMARDIALHHHAKWNGTGYTGRSAIPSPARDEIPLFARITAIADVYDALSSRRCYKDAWDSSKALEILRKDAGTHFDPELVGYFEEIQDVVRTIYEKYAD